MPFIENISRDNAKIGNHTNPGDNCLLIQISDPDSDFPVTKHKFTNVIQVKFLDIEDIDVENNPDWSSVAITDDQASILVDALLNAMNFRMNVTVHCHMGICRSGAIAEIGVMLGFDETSKYRQPNMRVKTKMMRILGWTYD